MCVEFEHMIFVVIDITQTAQYQCFINESLVIRTN